MDNASGFEYIVIFSEEAGRSQSFFLATQLWLGIRKGNPYLAYFMRSKMIFNQINGNTQKTYIFHLIVMRCFAAPPDAGSFNINANKVFITEFLRQAYSIFPSSTTQLQHNRMIIPEKFLVPIAF